MSRINFSLSAEHEKSFITLGPGDMKLSNSTRTDPIHIALHLQMSHLVGKPTMWFPNSSDTKQAAVTEAG